MINPKLLSSVLDDDYKTAAKIVDVNLIDNEIAEKKVGCFSQWASQDSIDFVPVNKTVTILAPDVYSVYLQGNVPVFHRCQYSIEDLIRFDDSRIDNIVRDIQHFWTKGEEFKKYSLAFKRGILIYGPPGSGKSCTIKLVINDIIKRGGIAIKWSDAFPEAIDALRQIQKDTPVVVIMEDLDAIMGNHGASWILNVLDGVTKIDNIVYMATTNYPEMLEERIANRPSRFDRRYEIGHPNDKSRKQYIEFLANKSDEVKIDIDKWVKDTKDLSISHIKELFISVHLLDREYDATLKELKDMSKQISSEMKKSFGFKSKVEY